MRFNIVYLTQEEIFNIQYNYNELTLGTEVIKYILSSWFHSDIFRVVAADSYFSLFTILEELKQLVLRFIFAVKTGKTNTQWHTSSNWNCLQQANGNQQHTCILIQACQTSLKPCGVTGVGGISLRMQNQLRLPNLCIGIIVSKCWRLLMLMQKNWA